MAMTSIMHIPEAFDDGNSMETSKQVTKALKCVAFTNMQVGDMMHRKYQRVEKRIQAISEEIQFLRTDVHENAVHQRERRQQLNEIAEDVERAQILGHSQMVEELLDELKVLQEEGRREEALCQSLKRSIRRRKHIKAQFIHEKYLLEEEMRLFSRKQNLIQTLLTTYTKKADAQSDTQGSSASQSDCDSSDVGDSTEEQLKNIKEYPDIPSPREERLKHTTPTRRWSSDDIDYIPREEARGRRSLSVSFSLPFTTEVVGWEEGLQTTVEVPESDESDEVYVACASTKPTIVSDGSDADNEESSTEDEIEDIPQPHGPNSAHQETHIEDEMAAKAAATLAIVEYHAWEMNFGQSNMQYVM